MIYEWDENKRISNLKKHGLDFAKAKYIFADAGRIFYPSYSGSDTDRFAVVGFSEAEFFIGAVIYTFRERKIRIISFRYASKKERRLYYEHNNNEE
jgi:uncharacterized DUF497 family protein